MWAEMAGSCQTTGWPIDVSLSRRAFRTSDSKRQTDKAAGENAEQPYAIYFLLQEEICYNSQTRQEEPLGLQKLMTRHLSQISNYKICTIDENMAANSIADTIATIQDEFHPELGTVSLEDKL